MRGRKRAETPLPEVLRPLIELLDALPVAILLTDAEGRLRYVNPAAAALSSQSPELGSSQWWEAWKLFRADGAPLPPEEYPLAMSSRAGTSGDAVELIVELPDGARHWMECAVRPLRDAEGRNAGRICSLMDITDRKQAGQAANLLSAIVDSSDDAILSKNLNRIITSWNQGAERLYGYAAREAIGRSILLITPPDLQREEISILEQIRNGKRIPPFETVRLRKDGRLLDLSVAISPIKDAAGRVIGASNVARDISARKRAENAVRESEARVAAEAGALAKLNEATARLWRMSDLQEGLEEMLDGAMALIGAEKGNVRLLDGERGVLRVAAQRGLGREFLDAFREVSAADDSAAGRALRMRQPIVIEDVETGSPNLRRREVARATGYRAVVSAPLIGTDGSPIGMLSMYFAAPHRPTEQDLRRLDLYVRQAADFILRCNSEQALWQSQNRFRALAERLDSEVRLQTRELEERNADVLGQAELLRGLSWQLMQAQEEERRHIARELHDSAGQLLVALGMNMDGIVEDAAASAPQLAKAAEKAREMVRQLTREIRTTSYLLHPPLLDESGLVAALRWYVHGLAERSGLEIALDIDESFGRLPRDLELAAFRIVQECLTNVHRHSGSRSAQIHIAREDQRLLVRVQDQGTGIPPERMGSAKPPLPGFGLRGMRERVRPYGGELQIESGPGGTTILVTVPIPLEPAAIELH